MTLYELARRLEAAIFYVLLASLLCVVLANTIARTVLEKPIALTYELTELLAGWAVVFGFSASINVVAVERKRPAWRKFLALVLVCCETVLLVYAIALIAAESLRAPFFTDFLGIPTWVGIVPIAALFSLALLKIGFGSLRVTLGGRDLALPKDH